MRHRENARGGEEGAPAREGAGEDQAPVPGGADPQLPAAGGLPAEAIA